ncbi:MAG TPA: NupC/NupG family nucleoside CNT transporter [candidate division Zixibacteria bacterium]|nr:NupC/NupG family nucleoside CNT transporter [candidate division Zixibacteria bacterium]
MHRFVGILGILTMICIIYLLSANKRAVKLRVIGWGLGLQFMFAVIVLKTGPGKWFFLKINDVVIGILGCAQEGAAFVFGNLVNMFVPVGQNGPDGFKQVQDLFANHGSAIFAFSVLPTIIFFSALMSLLYHYGVMQRIVLFMARIMSKTMKTSGAESLSAASNIFVGQTEAPLVVRPYLSKMTMSELNAIMVGGFATIAGGVMAAYVGLLKAQIPNIAGHLLSASIMSAPAGLMMAKIMRPEVDQPETAGNIKLTTEKHTQNGIDAIAAGAGDGLKLALNVAAMLVAFIGLIALINVILGLIHSGLSLSAIFGKVMSPLAWLMGITWKDAPQFGDLLGTQLMMNEFVSYTKLQGYAAIIDPRTAILATYALCGFSNLGSVGIQIGGISALAPDRRGDLAKLGLKAMLCGAFASWCTCCVAGILL